MEFYIFTISDIYVILLYVVLFWVVERFPRNFLVLIWSSIWPCFFDGIIQLSKHICNVALLRLLEKTLIVGVYTTKLRLLFFAKNHVPTQNRLFAYGFTIQFRFIQFQLRTHSKYIGNSELRNRIIFPNVFHFIYFRSGREHLPTSWHLPRYSRWHVSLELWPLLNW